MTLKDDVARLHEEACAKGERAYKDPDTGYWVMTRHYLEQRGHCCLTGCRHCPYGFQLSGSDQRS